MINEMPRFKEKLKKNVECPKCKSKITGTITIYENFPFMAYYAYCEKCDYPITESDWKEIK